MKTKEKIVVVGAGLAGLTTAYRLYQKGYDVEVYEARPRVGGRVHTVLVQNMDGNYSIAELGAQNMTDGGDATNIISLIKELEIDILEDDIKFKGSFYDGDYFHDRKTVLSSISIKNEELSKKLEEMAKTSHSMLDVLNQIVGERSIQKRMLTYMLNAYEGLPPQLLSAQPHNMRTLEHMLLGGLSQVHQAEQQPVIHRMTLKDGNATFPMKLAEKLHGRVHLEKVLKHVEYTNENKMHLTFGDGASIICDRLILAIPCSVYSDINFDEKPLILKS